MSQTIKLKRSSVAGKVPTDSDLDLGEIAINTYDGKMFIKKNDGSTDIMEVTSVSSGEALKVSKSHTAPSNPLEGDLWYDTSNDLLNSYNGTTWDAVGSTAVSSGSSIFGSVDSDTHTFNGLVYVKDNLTVDGNTILGDGSLDDLTVNATTDFIGPVKFNGVGFDDYSYALVGSMVSGNTETGISVTYDSDGRKLDFNVNDPTITLTGAVTGSGTMTNLGNVSITTTATSDPTITLTGDVTGTGTMTNLGDVSFATTIAANSVALGTDTTGNYVATITAGNGISVSGSGSESAAVTVSHSDTSTLSGTYNATSGTSATQAAGSVVRGLVVDSNGHVTGINWGTAGRSTIIGPNGTMPAAGYLFNMGHTGDSNALAAYNSISAVTNGSSVPANTFGFVP